MPTCPCKYSKFFSKIHQVATPKKTCGILSQFPNRQKGNKESYDYIGAFIHQLKEYIGEHIATRYIKCITGMKIGDYDNKKVLHSHHTSKHQYYEQWYF